MGSTRRCGQAALFCLGIFISTLSHAATWPASTSGVSLSAPLRTILPSGEPSGIIFHHALATLVMVSDEGSVCALDEDGSNPECVFIGGNDLEGVTIADESTHLVYLAVEYPYAILEFNLDTMALTGKRWTISDLTTATNQGIEAVAFIPNGLHPFANSSSGGVFYVGVQETGQIVAYSLNLAASGTATRVGQFTPISGRNDIADLFFHEETETLFAVFDGANMLTEMETDGTILNDFNIPGDDQEGITLIGSCADGKGKMLVAEDSGPAAGPDLWSYANYPLDCAPVVIDADADGFPVEQDCNDNDRNIHALQLFYRDADGDGLGNPAVSTSVCSLSAPSGFVANANDSNDSIVKKSQKPRLRNR